MSRIPNRGEQPAMHPVLQKVPALDEQDLRDITDFLYAHPQIAEAIEWIHDNVDPVFVPDGLGLFWRGFLGHYGVPRIPLSLTIAGPSSLWGNRLKDDPQYELIKNKYFAFLTDLNRKFPDADRLMHVYL